MRVDTAAAVGKYIYGCSCGSKHCCGSGEVLVELLRERTTDCCGSGEILGRLLRERALLRQWGIY